MRSYVYSVVKLPSYDRFNYKILWFYFKFGSSKSLSHCLRKLIFSVASQSDITDNFGKPC